MYIDADGELDCEICGVSLDCCDFAEHCRFETPCRNRGSDV
jgi:hypothetical protein